MKALSLKPMWALEIFLGYKMIECRSWKTDYRGELLICASSDRETGTIDSHAVCVVTLEDVLPFSKEHLEDADMENMPDKPSYAWIINNIRLIEPFPVKGKLKLFEVDDDLIHFPNEQLDYKAILKEYYLPKVYFAKGDQEGREIWDDIISGKEITGWNC